MDVKNRLKKFYHDHEKFINGFTAGVTFAGIIGMRAVSNTKDGMQLDDAKAMEYPDGSRRLFVSYKNGKTVSAPWEITE